ncbi:M23 family metallopeptidase [Altererythrobacter sp. MF3-039]|uniref:M23 family metallopeptidase n=1 Tax=Altererythrobacter sp. MF3-039 TaxID=3252901 RepID=UPI00390C7363
MPTSEAAREPVIAAFRYSGELTQGGWLRGTAPAGAVEAFLGNERLELAEDGTFFAAFDRDEGAEATLRARLEDGRQIIETLVVAPRAWNIEHVNVAKRSGGSSEAWWKKREPEWNAINAAREKNSDSTGWTRDFIWPVTGRISGRFGSQRIYRGETGSYHSGIDIAPGRGTPFVAPADGVVTLAAKTPFSLEGHLIIIDHGQGLNSAFLHSESIAVEEGQVVRQGERLGTVGSSGRATGPHLHWSLKWRDARLDPLLFAGPMR